MKKTGLILLLVLALFRTPSCSRSQTIEDDLDSFAKSDNFNGTILIRKDSRIILRKSYGYANFQFKIPNTPETRYKIASITKAFTAVLILQLADRGLIDPEQPFGAYLPEYQGPAAGQVTVKQLMNMTSGLRNMDDGVTLETVLRTGMPQYQLPHTPDELLSPYSSYPLVDKPGTRFDYNNADFIILGKIVEKRTGKAFEEALKENILEPLKMTSTGMMTQEKIVDKLADTYFYRDDLKMLSNDFPVYWGNWYAAGGMYSTADDVDKFSEALFGGKLISKAAMKMMFTSGPGEYGLGVWVYTDYDIKNRMYTIVKRPGNIMGAQSMLFHILENGSNIIILSNTGTVSLDDLAAKIAEQITD